MPLGKLVRPAHVQHHGILSTAQFIELFRTDVFMGLGLLAFRLFFLRPPRDWPGQQNQRDCQIHPFHHANTYTTGAAARKQKNRVFDVPVSRALLPRRSKSPSRSTAAANKFFLTLNKSEQV